LRFGIWVKYLHINITKKSIICSKTKTPIKSMKGFEPLERFERSSSGS